MKRASIFLNGIITVDTFGNILCDGISISEHIKQAIPIEKKKPIEYQEKQFPGTVTLILSDISEEPEIHKMEGIKMDNFGLDFAQYQRDRQEGPSPYEEDEKIKEEIHEALNKFFKGE